MGAMPRRGRGRRSGSGKGSRGQGLFKPPRWKYLARIVKMDTVENARKAARKLVQLFKGAKSRVKKRRIKAATILAMNRARASAKRKNLSTEERRELSLIAKIYEKAAKKMKI